MVLKRFVGQEECDESSAPEAKRPRLLIATMRDVMGAQCMQSHLSKLEPFLRRVVQEEVQNAFNHHVHSVTRILPTTLIEPSVSRLFQLHFHNTLPQTIYTGSRIEAEGGVPLQVLIVDVVSKSIITSGPFASAKIEILALDGDFGDEDDWSEKHFVDNIVRERDGKRPLLSGELIITLSQGVGYVNDASFTDNSSWIRSRKFRLGARVCSSKLMEGRIREAKSEAFLVKDHRGESYKKHHPPSLNDEVWRLEKIGKDGAFHKRLSENEIHTVQDFLRNLVMDSSKLRSLLGNGMSNKIWEATLEHARECVPDDKLYSYCGGGGFILIFNSIYQLIGAIIDHMFHHMNELSASQKIIVDKLKELAYRNQNDIAELSLPVHTFTKLPAIDGSINPPVSCWSEPQIPDIPAGTLQDEPNTHQLSVLQLSQHHGPRSGLLEDLVQLKDVFGPTQRFGSLNNYNCHEREFFDLPEGKASAIMTTEQPFAGHNNSDFDLLSSFMPPLWDNGKALSRTSDGSLSFPTSHTGTSARIGSSRWVKLIAALKWLFIMRQLAARRAVEPANVNRIAEIGYPALTTAMCTDATTWW